MADYHMQQSLAAVQAPEFESELVDQFISCLTAGRSPWRLAKVMQEFQYSTGRTDVVASTNTGAVVAFEAKLKRWRDALNQAYRNKAFANTSYVLMPYTAALKSAEYCGEFERYGVGLCSLKNDEVTILITATHDTPVLKWLAEKAQKRLAEENEKPNRVSQCDMRFAWSVAD